MNETKARKSRSKSVALDFLLIVVENSLRLIAATPMT
jgi:hypothetical protein